MRYSIEDRRMDEASAPRPDGAMGSLGPRALQPGLGVILLTVSRGINISKTGVVYLSGYLGDGFEHGKAMGHLAGHSKPNTRNPKPKPRTSNLKS